LLSLLNFFPHNLHILRDKPLAMYVFGKNDKIYDELRHKTSSGSIVYNEVLMQAGLECLPFGGVGGRIKF
jgi:acyl-CoA reductase-like NAD-dependent aldehyde dehydrogenase